MTKAEGVYGRGFVLVAHLDQYQNCAIAFRGVGSTGISMVIKPRGERISVLTHLCWLLTCAGLSLRKGRSRRFLSFGGLSWARKIISEYVHQICDLLCA